VAWYACGALSLVPGLFLLLLFVSGALVHIDDGERIYPIAICGVLLAAGSFCVWQGRRRKVARE
jgi:hypothetical protein